MLPQSIDVVVVGAGNAALCAALSAAEEGASVLVLERAPVERARRQHAASRPARCAVVYDGVDDLRAADARPHRGGDRDAPTSAPTREDAVLRRHGPRDRVPHRTPTWPSSWSPAASTRWCGCARKGVRFVPIYGRQAFKVDGRFKFWGGLTRRGLGRRAGPGRGAVPARAAKAASTIAYRRARARARRRRRRRPRRRVRQSTGRTTTIARKAVVLACGGFEANAEMAHALSRARLGPRQGARHALQHRRRHPHGARHRRHAVRQLVGLPRGRLGPQRARVRRPRGRRRLPEAQLPVRHHGQRRRRALRRRGRRLPQLHLRQVRPRDPRAAAASSPGRSSTRRSLHLLRDEYRIKQVTKVARRHARGAGAASSTASIADAAFRRRSREYNAAVRSDVPFNPNVKDGRRTAGLAIDKSNWANTIDKPPFEAYAVTCGITFTFGGLRIDTDGAGARHRRRRRSPACTPPASWSAGSSTSTIPAAPG